MPNTIAHKPSPRTNPVVRNALITEDRYGFTGFPQIPGSLAHEMVWQRTRSVPNETRRIPDSTHLKQKKKRVFTVGISEESRLPAPTFLLEKDVVIPSNLPGKVKFFRYKDMTSLEVLNSQRKRNIENFPSSAVDELLNLHPVLPAIGHFAREGIPSKRALSVPVPPLIPAPTALDATSQDDADQYVEGNKDENIPGAENDVAAAGESGESGQDASNLENKEDVVDDGNDGEKHEEAQAPETKTENESENPSENPIVNDVNNEDALKIESGEEKTELSEEKTPDNTENIEAGEQIESSTGETKEITEEKTDDKTDEELTAQPEVKAGDDEQDAEAATKEKVAIEEELTDQPEVKAGDDEQDAEAATKDESEGAANEGLEYNDVIDIPTENPAPVPVNTAKTTKNITSPERPDTGVPQNSPRQSLEGNKQTTVDILAVNSTRKMPPELHLINLEMDPDQIYEIKCKRDIKAMYPMFEHKKTSEDRLFKVSFDESSLKKNSSNAAKDKKLKHPTEEDFSKEPALDVPSSPNRESEYRRKFRRARKKKVVSEVVVIPRDYICADDIVVRKPLTDEHAPPPENLFSEYLTVLKANIAKEKTISKDFSDSHHSIPVAPPGSRLGNNDDPEET